MNKLSIYEPAMCCPTGLCGVGVNPELMRISTVLNTLKNSGVVVERYNLNSAPMEFVTNQAVNAYLNAHGPEGLPLVLLNNQIVIERRYPTNEELTKLLDIPADMLLEKGGLAKSKVTIKKSGGCNCKGGCC